MDPLVAQSRAAIQKGSKSFAAAAHLFAPRTREGAFLLYAWCRHCDDVTDEQVYQVARAILENTKEFRKYHRAGRLWNLERTARDPKLPFHNGVIKYLKEKDVWTDELEAQHKAMLR